MRSLSLETLPPQDTLLPVTLAAQQALARYCRSDEAAGVPGALPDRLEQYRRLARNVIADGLESAYPLTVAALDPFDWETLVYRFFAEHDCQEAQVWRMPMEFMEFVQGIAEAPGRPAGLLDKYPFLLELLFFEWTEIELYMMEDLPVPAYGPVRNWTQDTLVFHPEHRLLLFSYPVHLGKPDAEPGQYAVLAFRDPETGEVQFIDLSLTFAWLLDGLITTGCSLAAFLEQHPEAPAALLLAEAPAFFQHLSGLRFIRGARR
ncbi:HvfC/BufC N-terminal domain-containing protein [Dinghuibacter silviterrae]|uniref:Uncharacterized protein n=1 Tax=Dinghuibacter silviterrae TaxID=1539049 RepID=A0A4R8DPE9_9BACT|nr:putative DNA-binding domain-containing protein [Dinghuibacter silviterrae]TDW99605.1 hypothetical protein EDB95_0615 [Dinghuibacter silviterrae]